MGHGIRSMGFNTRIVSVISESTPIFYCSSSYINGEHYFSEIHPPFFCNINKTFILLPFRCLFIPVIILKTSPQLVSTWINLSWKDMARILYGIWVLFRHQHSCCISHLGSLSQESLHWVVFQGLFQPGLFHSSMCFSSARLRLSYDCFFLFNIILLVCYSALIQNCDKISSFCGTITWWAFGRLYLIKVKDKIT